MNVYLISDGEHYKIGKAKNIFNRIKSLNHSTENSLELLDSITLSNDLHSHRAERWLHNALEDYHSHGEWFSFKSKEEAIQKFQLYKERAAEETVPEEETTYTHIEERHESLLPKFVDDTPTGVSSELWERVKGIEEKVDRILSFLEEEKTLK